MGVGLLVATFDWSFARLIAPLVTITSTILTSSTLIQNGYILVSANPGPSGKWPLKQTENYMEDIYYINWKHISSTLLVTEVVIP